MAIHETEATIRITCVGQFKKGQNGEPDAIDNFKVYFFRFGEAVCDPGSTPSGLKPGENAYRVAERLEITDWLTDKEFEALYDEMLEVEGEE